MNINIKSSVGALGENRPADVRIARAEINVVMRALCRPTLLIDGRSDEELVEAIKFIQQRMMNLSAASGLIKPKDLVCKWLDRFLVSSFKPVAHEKPTEGLLTWEAEGQEGGPFHSRKLHVPGPTSGLTIGRGYDCKTKSTTKIVRELTQCGVDGSEALIISGAAGLRGPDAEAFIIENDLLDWEISSEGQLKLFKVSYEEHKGEVRRLSNKPDAVSAYGSKPLEELDWRIREMLIDISFRGDYSPNCRKIIQKAAMENDLAEFKKLIEDRSLWENVPNERFRLRVNFIRQ